MSAKPALTSAAAVLSVSLATFAQYTPGTGGTYLPSSTPNLPAPAAPVTPQSNPPAAPYSWQTPPPPQAQPQPQLQPGLAPTDPNAVRVIQPPDYQQPIVVPRLSDAQLADLTASIALYPDPLLGELFPATTYIEECTFADRWLAQHPAADPYAIDRLPLHPEVKDLMHYPAVLALLSNNLDWSQALGIAFLYQRNDLMEAVQRWRYTAVTYGTLYSTPQSQIVQQGNTIYILPPPRTQVIYVPTYDPAVVFVRPRRPVTQSVITFSSVGFSLEWVHNDVDWHNHEVRVPVHHDADHGGPDRGGDRGAPDRGRAGAPPPRLNPMVVSPDNRGGRGDEKTVFVHDTVKAGIVYPDKIVTPTDHKEIIVPSTLPGRGGRGGAGGGGFETPR